MRLVNLTPHAVVVYGTMELPVYTLKPCENPARIETKTVYYPKFVIRRDLVGAENLPEPVEGVVYVVSNKFRVRFPERKDLASPNDEVIDPKTNNVVGCRYLEIN